MVWNELTSNLEVLWGALIALVIVVLLTPPTAGVSSTTIPTAMSAAQTTSRLSVRAFQTTTVYYFVP